MRIERTKTYVRVFIGPHYVTFIRPEPRNVKAMCCIIREAEYLDKSELDQMESYFRALGRDK